jgi:hypothetical protein
MEHMETPQCTIINFAFQKIYWLDHTLIPERHTQMATPKRATRCHSTGSFRRGVCCAIISSVGSAWAVREVATTSGTSTSRRGSSAYLSLGLVCDEAWVVCSNHILDRVSTSGHYCNAIQKSHAIRSHSDIVPYKSVDQFCTAALFVFVDI